AERGGGAAPGSQRSRPPRARRSRARRQAHRLLPRRLPDRDETDAAFGQELTERDHARERAVSDEDRPRELFGRPSLRRPHRLLDRIDGAASSLSNASAERLELAPGRREIGRELAPRAADLL